MNTSLSKTIAIINHKDRVTLCNIYVTYLTAFSATPKLPSANKTNEIHKAPRKTRIHNMNLYKGISMNLKYFGCVSFFLVADKALLVIQRASWMTNTRSQLRLLDAIYNFWKSARRKKIKICISQCKHVKESFKFTTFGFTRKHISLTQTHICEDCSMYNGTTPSILTL